MLKPGLNLTDEFNAIRHAGDFEKSRPEPWPDRTVWFDGAQGALVLVPPVLLGSGRRLMEPGLVPEL